MANPKALAHKHLPGLGEEGQYEVGLVNVGRTVVNSTITLNTVQTDAELIATPSNHETIVTTGVFMHSLCIAPTLAVVQVAGISSVGPIGFAIHTMNNSAVFVRARASSDDLSGAQVRIVVIR